MVRAAARDGIDVVVAAGGDGTADLVAEELLGSDTALAILPLGSVMNLARALGIPRDLEPAAAIIRDGEVRRVDVGEVEAADGRRLRFFEAGSVGMNAALFREAARFDDGDWVSILRTIWVALRYRPARMRLELDDDVVETRALMITASIGPYTGVGMTVAPDAKVDDGRFDVRVFRGFSKFELLRHLFAIALGRRAVRAAGVDLSVVLGAGHERPSPASSRRRQRSGVDPGRVPDADPGAVCRRRSRSAGSARGGRLVWGDLGPAAHVVLGELAAAAVVVEPAHEDVREFALDLASIVGQVASPAVGDEHVAIDGQDVVVGLPRAGRVGIVLP